MAAPRPYGHGPYGSGHYSRYAGVIHDAGTAVRLTLGTQFRVFRVSPLGAAAWLDFEFDAALQPTWPRLAPCETGIWKKAA